MFNKNPLYNKTITLNRLCVDQIIIESWNHSGPINVEVKDIRVDFMLDDIVKAVGEKTFHEWYQAKFYGAT